MAAPKKEEQDKLKEENKVPNKIRAKIVQLGISCDLVGSAMTLRSMTGTELEISHLGIIATSAKGNKRRVLIPWANVKGVELMPE